MPKLKNSNATFWVIFKHCDIYSRLKKVESVQEEDDDRPVMNLWAAASDKRSLRLPCISGHPCYALLGWLLLHLEKRLATTTVLLLSLLVVVSLSLLLQLCCLGQEAISIVGRKEMQSFLLLNLGHTSVWKPKKSYKTIECCLLQVLLRLQLLVPAGRHYYTFHHDNSLPTKVGKWLRWGDVVCLISPIFLKTRVGFFLNLPKKKTPAGKLFYVAELPKIGLTYIPNYNLSCNLLWWCAV